MYSTTLMPSRSGALRPSFLPSYNVRVSDDERVYLYCRFNLGTLQPRLSSQLISTIHGILKFFLLRRLKADVFDKSLPPKNEHVIYCPLSVEQWGLYDAIVEGSLRHLLLSCGGSENVKREEDTGRCQRASGVGG
ncbi:hypothetical protein BKA83DRAFT_1740292 [Pisolithus microcarpus]|nr:hypothetical protein BKA83DRAFT_1740292 [Pisolithus microcarpus]